jgi:hypothetical protein
MRIGVLSRECQALLKYGATEARGDWSHYDILAVDPDHLSGAIRKIVRDNLALPLLTLSGDVTRDLRRMNSPPSPTSRRTLEVCDTGVCDRRYGFSLGLGALFRNADRGRAGGLGALRGALQREPTTVRVDGELLGESLSLAAVSTHPRFPFRLRAPHPPDPTEVCFVWNDLDTAGWIRHGLSLLRGTPQLPAHRAGTARRISFDIRDAGYSLDGALHVADGARIVSVRRGPDVQVCD